jgi:F-type H+-transporting ATPase subunit b
MDTLFDLSSFIIQAINFAIVALVLRSFLFKPYMQYLEVEAQKRALLETQLADSDAILSTAKDESEKIVDKARVDGKIMGAEIVENARKEASEIVERAESDAAAARNK